MYSLIYVRACLFAWERAYVCKLHSSSNQNTSNTNIDKKYSIELNIRR